MHNTETFQGRFSSIAFDEVLPPATSPETLKFRIHKIDLLNSSGGDASMGFGVKVSTDEWKAGQWDDSTTGSEYTDDTTDAQDAGTNDFALTTTTNNDGLLIQSKVRFNFVGFTVSTAEVGSPVYEYAYWNGSSWTTFTPFIVPDFTATGDTVMAFGIPPQLWAQGAEDSDKFAIRIRATTAPSTAPLATKLQVGMLMDYIEKVSDGAHAFQDYGDDGIVQPFVGPLFGYCSTANTANRMMIEYSKTP